MISSLNRYDGFSPFDDKGEVKRLVDFLIQKKDPGVTIDSLRKIDFAYIITLSRPGNKKEVELTRSEIDASWDWRRGNVDETLQKKINDTVDEF